MGPGKVVETAVVSEMEIVDFCTKLIFEVDEELSQREQTIISALCMSDENFSGDVVEMGKYLRALGVREMIKLVAAAKLHMDAGHVLFSDNHQNKNMYIH